MSWYPPRAFEERYRWAKDHPWLAGLYWGLFMAITFTVIAVAGGAGWTGVIANVLIWSIGGLFFGFIFRWGVRRGWGERPDADKLPVPTRRRPWVRASERSLNWMLRIYSVAGLGLLATLIGRLVSGAHETGRIVLDVVVLVGSAWFVTTTWRERSQRLREREIGQL